MTSLSVHGMDLNISYKEIHSNNIDINAISSSLVELYKKFDEENISYPLNLEPIKQGVNKIKFKKSLDLILPDSGYILAHWYIYDSAEYELSFANLPKELLYINFNGNKVYPTAHLKNEGFELELQGTGDLIYEQTGFFWHEKGEINSKILDVNLLDLNGKYTKSNKMIKEISGNIFSAFSNETDDKVTNIRRVILENSKTSISYDLFRDGEVITKTISENGVDGASVDKKLSSALEANKEIDIMIKDLLSQGFELINDMAI
jgi:hypothetical protein